jgi:predicted acetyltransferase
VQAGLVELSMGQWFQRRRVSLLGIAGVAVAPEARGQGLARALVGATLRAARERGVALSMLYPSTFTLYRGLGYELAGSLCRFTLQLRTLGRERRRGLPVRALDAERGPAVEALYREVARERNGYLDRCPYVWGRVRTPAREPSRCFGVEGEQGLVGYVQARAAVLRRNPLELSLSDFVVKSPLALSSLLRFLAEHTSTVERVSWHGGPGDARMLGLPERGFSTTLEEYWMLRVVHVERALLERGYPPFDAALDLDVSDELLPENARVYALRVNGGVATLGKPGGAPRVRLSVSALAALYSGFTSPAELVLLGQLAADEAAASALGALFAGPAPTCADFF